VLVGLTLQAIPPELADRIIQFPHCSDEELRALYSRAQLLLAPSLYEGFGLPVLEAMACGCPVLVGNRSSLPEIVGRAGIQVDPFQVEAIVRGIRQVLDDPGLSRELRHQGLQRAREFTWEKTTRIVLNTYKALGRTLKK
jgi:glycosyltransferase involved in cell wall biosynthesis